VKAFVLISVLDLPWGGRTSRKERILPRFLVSVLIVFILLILYSFVGAIVFLELLSTNTSLTDYGRDLLFLILPVLLTALVGYFLGRGIRSIKSPFEALVLTYLSTFFIGGVLALLTVLNLSYSAHVNFSWLGSAWYDPIFTIFLIGAPIALAFLV